MSDPEYERRKDLTFEEAEGIVPIAEQLEKANVSPKLRAYVWAAISISIDSTTIRGNSTSGVWSNILKTKLLTYDHGMIDEFDYQKSLKKLKTQIQAGDWIVFYGVLQSILRCRSARQDFIESLSRALEISLSPYRIFKDTLLPIVTQAERESIDSALLSTEANKLIGSASHLKLSMKMLSQGNWADSIRESIHAVESAARQIGGGGSLSGALDRLGNAGHIHRSMNEAFKKLYGYASDENGIRHPLLQEGDAKVTESDAIFMLGACASFVTYLITNARKAGLLT